MAYQFENVKLEKGMYGQSGKSFTKVLEALDPSEAYRGTALEGLDAFQRQLKRFDIHVKGAGTSSSFKTYSFCSISMKTFCFKTSFIYSMRASA